MNAGGASHTFHGRSNQPMSSKCEAEIGADGNFVMGFLGLCLVVKLVGCSRLIVARVASTLNNPDLSYLRSLKIIPVTA